MITSEEAKDLISHMLCDENNRYTAKMVLDHPWLQHSYNNKRTISKLNIKHLETYKNSSNFKKFILTYIASRVKEKEIKELKDIFSELDLNKDGILDIDEIRQGLIKFNSEKNLNNEEINEIFKGIDTNNSKRIEYTEFISAAIEKNEFLKSKCGSLCFAAPEMISGKRYTGVNVDIWASGVILYSMICGFLPFQEEDSKLLYDKIIKGKYQIPYYISQNAGDLIHRILRVNPNKRYTIEQIKKHRWFNMMDKNTNMTKGLLLEKYE